MICVEGSRCFDAWRHALTQVLRHTDETLLLNTVPSARITPRHRLPINADDFGRGLITCVRRIEVALLHRVAVTVITILLDLLLCLAIGRIRNHVVRVGGLLRGLR